MPSYMIIACDKCGGYILARSGQKTRTCPYCGSKLILGKLKKIATTENASEASTLLRKLKERKVAKHRGMLGFKSNFKKSHQTYSK